MLAKSTVLLAVLALCGTVAHAQKKGALPAYDGDCTACVGPIGNYYCNEDATCWANSLDCRDGSTCSSISGSSMSCSSFEHRCEATEVHGALGAWVIFIIIILPCLCCSCIIGLVVYCVMKPNPAPVIVMNSNPPGQEMMLPQQPYQQQPGPYNQAPPQPGYPPSGM